MYGDMDKVIYIRQPLDFAIKSGMSFAMFIIWLQAMHVVISKQIWL